MCPFSAISIVFHRRLRRCPFHQLCIVIPLLTHPSLQIIHYLTMATTTMAGCGTRGRGDGTTQTSAQFSRPRGLATNRAGEVYVADQGSIRKLAGGVVSTFCGSKFGTGYADGVGGNARFHKWSDNLAMARGGVLYVADRENHRIRKITTDGRVSTFAGSGKKGAADGQGVAAEFNLPAGLAADREGNLFVADCGNGLIRIVTPAGAVSTLGGRQGGRGEAPCLTPSGIAVDSKGYAVVADFDRHRVVKIAPSGAMSTLAGSVAGFANGPIAGAMFYGPCGLVIDGEDNIFVVDTYNYRIRKISPCGSVTTVAGSGHSAFADGLGTNARFSRPSHIAIDNRGNLLVSDQHRIRCIAAGLVVPASLRPVRLADRYGRRRRRPGGASCGSVLTS